MILLRSYGKPLFVGLLLSSVIVFFFNWKKLYHDSVAVLDPLLGEYYFKLTSDEQFRIPNGKYEFLASTKTGHPHVQLKHLKPICTLPKLDPWDKSIINLIDSNFRTMNHCNSHDQPIKTVLSGGILSFEKRMNNNESAFCMFRCLTYATEYKYAATKWIAFEEPTKTKCEVIETRCLWSNDMVYLNLHTQIVAAASPTVHNKPNANNTKIFQPSVIIILFDSTSSSAGQRALSQTLQVLRHKYDAVYFRGHNKAADSSRPNAWAMFTGIRIDDLPPGTFHENGIKAELPDSCIKDVDDYPYVGFNFSRAGYVTTLIEDWALGAFNFRNCNGFRNNPVTHNMRPYWIRLEENENVDKMMNDNCETTFGASMKYLQQFIDAYKVENASKFAIFWISDESHSHVNGLYRIDPILSKFFIDNEDRLQESFIFLMGDHGLRHTDIRKTEIGKIEDNNPMLVISAPKSLRHNSEMHANLRRNSRHLTTHYDLYATLLDIAEIAPRSGFANLSVYDWSSHMAGKRGSSLLRPLDHYSIRDCKSLDVPEPYCICERNKTTIENASSNDMMRRAALLLTISLNELIAEHRSSHICHNLVFRSVQSAQQIITDESHKIYYLIRYDVSPSNGLFEGVVRLINASNNGESLKVIGKVQDRINSYDDDSNCVYDEALRPICKCIAK